MIDYIKEIYKEDEHDGFIFILDEEENLDISAFTYKQKSKPIEIHPEIGLKYHIIIYKEMADGTIKDPEMFEAILGNPHYYAANLMQINIFGTICKKTKSSTKIVKAMFKDLLKSFKEQERLLQADIK